MVPPRRLEAGPPRPHRPRCTLSLDPACPRRGCAVLEVPRGAGGEGGGRERPLDGPRASELVCSLPALGTGGGGGFGVWGEGILGGKSTTQTLTELQVCVPRQEVGGALPPSSPQNPEPRGPAVPGSQPASGTRDCAPRSGKAPSVRGILGLSVACGLHPCPRPGSWMQPAPPRRPQPGPPASRYVGTAMGTSHSLPVWPVSSRTSWARACLAEPGTRQEGCCGAQAGAVRVEAGWGPKAPPCPPSACGAGWPCPAESRPGIGTASPSPCGTWAHPWPRHTQAWPPPTPSEPPPCSPVPAIRARGPATPQPGRRCHPWPQLLPLEPVSCHPPSTAPAASAAPPPRCTAGPPGQGAWGGLAGPRGQ